MYEQDVALNNLQRLICHKTKRNETTSLKKSLQVLSSDSFLLLDLLPYQG